MHVPEELVCSQDAGRAHALTIYHQNRLCACAQRMIILRNVPSEETPFPYSMLYEDVADSMGILCTCTSLADRPKQSYSAQQVTYFYWYQYVANRSLR